LRAPPLAHHLDECRQARNNDEEQGNQREVRLDPWGIAHRVAERAQPHNPDQRPKHIADHEASRIHARHARHEGRESPYERKKAPHDDRDGAITLVETLGAVKGCAVEPAGLFPAEDARTNPSSHRVVHEVAEDRGRGQQCAQGTQVESAEAGDCSGNEEQRIARQKGHHHKPGFHKDHRKQRRVDPGAPALRKFGQMPVEVKQDIH